MAFEVDVEKMEVRCKSWLEELDGREITARFEIDDTWTIEQVVDRCWELLSDVALDILSPYM